MIKYEDFRFIFPPRPENALSPELIKTYDNGTFLAQPKLNGDCMEVFTNGIDVHLFNRYGEPFKDIQIDINSFKQLYRETVPNAHSNKWMNLIGEYMIKSKKNESGKIWNQKLVLHDTIVYDGVQLIGKTFRERVQLLDKLYGKDDTILTDDGVEHLHFLYSTPVKDIFRVKTYEDCFLALWKDLVKIDMYEGLILKRASSKLENGNSEKNNMRGQLKFRKSTKNYPY